MLNAQHMVDAGAALVFEQEGLTAERLAQEILSLASDDERRRGMENASSLMGRPEASRDIVDAMDDLIRGAA